VNLYFRQSVGSVGGDLPIARKNILEIKITYFIKNDTLMFGKVKSCPNQILKEVTDVHEIF
jgi:hypothetical protein